MIHLLPCLFAGSDVLDKVWFSIKIRWKTTQVFYGDQDDILLKTIVQILQPVSPRARRER